MRVVSGLMMLCLTSGQAAHAIEISHNGSTATLSGPIRDGDQFRLREFLATPEGRQVKMLRLTSPGGRVFPAREMARDIRSAGLVTIVDASRDSCNSACTGLFAAGVRRLYLNAGFEDGAAVKTGLGFHEGNAPQQSGGRGYSGPATADMNNIYYEMGVPGAASLITKATFNRMYKISGQTALSLGIATSLSAR